MSCPDCRRAHDQAKRLLNRPPTTSWMCDGHFSSSLSKAVIRARGGRLREVSMDLDFPADVHEELIGALGSGDDDAVLQLYRKVTDLNVEKALRALEDLDDQL